MPEIISCNLDNRRILRIGGSEAESFLQGILTCNLETIPNDGAGFGGLLTPQGKIMFDFFVIRDDAGFLLDVDERQIEDLVRRLTFYRLRADVTLDICKDGTLVYTCWNDTDQSSGSFDISDHRITVPDPRMDKMGWRIYSKTAPTGTRRADIDEYHLHRIHCGVPEGGVDYHYGDAFPHEALYDQIGGVDFTKGCYVGQEVVSRMHHRGTARKRIIQISSKNKLPVPGSKISVSEKSVGEVTSVSNNTGLAILRLDHVGRAITGHQSITAGDIVITPKIQSWVNFDWPDDRKQVN